MQCLVNMAHESELPSQAVTVFAWSSKKHVVLIYDKGGKNNGEKTASLISGAGKTGQLHVKE